jgi:hypothetical protein
MTKAVMKITVGEGKYHKCDPIIQALCSLTHLICFGKFLLYLASSTKYTIHSKLKYMIFVVVLVVGIGM